MILSSAERFLMMIFLFFSMLSIGAQIDWRELSFLKNRKRLWLKLLIANFIVVPILGIVFAKTFPLSSEVSMAFIALALTPGGINAIQFASKIPGGAVDAAVMLLLLSLLAILFSPFLIAYFVPPGIDLSVSYGKLARFFLLFMLFPIFIGVLFRHYLTSLAQRSAKIFALIGTLAFITMIILTLSIRQATISAHTLEVVAIMLLFIALTMLIGWLLGGPEKHHRQLFIIITSMRNVAICLAIVMETAPTAKVVTPLVALSALMVLPNMVLTIIILTHNKMMLNKKDQPPKVRC